MNRWLDIIEEDLKSLGVEKLGGGIFKIETDGEM